VTPAVADNSSASTWSPPLPLCEHDTNPKNFLDAICPDARANCVKAAHTYLKNEYKGVPYRIFGDNPTKHAMFSSQQALLESIPTLHALLLKHDRPSDWLEYQGSIAEHFSVRVPLLGAFSAGKSTLLNTWLDETIFNAGLEPETAIPAEIFAAAGEGLFGCRSDGSRIPITRKDIRNKDIALRYESGWLEIGLPAAPLVNLPHLRVVDMPGWDSNFKGHTDSIRDYAARSLGLILTVSVEDGTVRQSIRESFTELKLFHLPIVVVITKSDKKTAQETAAVAEQVRRDVLDITGVAPFRVVIVSSRKHEIDDFEQALVALEKMAEPLFISSVLRPVADGAVELRGYLQTLLDRDNVEGEALELKLKSIEKDAEAFEEALVRETKALETRVIASIERIIERVASSLSGQVDSFAGEALRGVDVRPRIEQAVRIAVTQGIEQDFAPEVRRYRDSVNLAIPVTIQAFGTLPVKQTGDVNLQDIGPVFTVLSELLLLIPKLGTVIGPALKFVLPLLSLLGGGDRNADALKRREEMADHFRYSVIPAALEQARTAVKSALEAQVSDIACSIHVGVQARRETLVAALERARAASLDNQEQYETFVADCQRDLKSLSAWLARFEAEMQQ
jgi:GTPase SAR1 family protein